MTARPPAVDPFSAPVPAVDPFSAPVPAVDPFSAPAPAGAALSAVGGSPHLSDSRVFVAARPGAQRLGTCGTLTLSACDADGVHVPSPIDPTVPPSTATVRCQQEST